MIRTEKHLGCFELAANNLVLGQPRSKWQRKRSRQMILRMLVQTGSPCSEYIEALKK